MHVAIAGNIGCGKTTLTSILAKHFKWEPIYEAMESNPYIELFYEDMRRWAFNLQIYFLNTRFRRVVDARSKYDKIIQDRTLFEDACIFAPNLYEMGLMTTRDFETYKAMFELLSSFVPIPDLVIYMKASEPTLIRQILKRGRAYEASISLEYIKTLNLRYEEWINNYTGRYIVIDMDEMDLDIPEDLNKIIEKINAEINGLF
ncbi:MAG: deoxynucleoside kinase [Bacteroidales bacterium]|jgi:deoxyadenosine/deoxycytidine kinase|nr:deoxynucleoside kinase [Bacteroidales bacterium]